MRSGEMLRQVGQMLAASQDEAVAVSREVHQRRRLLEALYTVMGAADDLGMAGYAVVPLEPTPAMLNAGWAGFQSLSDGSDIANAWRAMVAAAAEQDEAG